MSENKATTPSLDQAPTEHVRDHSEPTLKTPSISPADAEKLAERYQASWEQLTPAGEALPQDPASTSDSGAWSRSDSGRPSGGDRVVDGKLDPDQTGRTSAVPMASARRNPAIWGMAAVSAVVLLIIISLVVRSRYTGDGSEIPAQVEEARHAGDLPIVQEPRLPTPQLAAPQAPAQAPQPVVQPTPPPQPVAAPPPPPPQPEPQHVVAPPPPPPQPVVSRPSPPAPPPVVQRQATPAPQSATPSRTTPAHDTRAATPARTTSPQPANTGATPRRRSGGFIADNPY